MFFVHSQIATFFSWPSLSFVVLVISLLITSYILWRRYRSRRQLIRQVAELEALSMAGRALVSAQLDVNALCALIAQEAGQIIDNSTFQVGLFEEELYHILFWCIDGRLQNTPRTFDISHDTGVVGWVRTTKQPLLVHDFIREATTLPARPRYISDSPPRSAIFLPLISGEETIGIVAAQSRQPNRFTEDDLRRLMILANQAAAAIANAQLYQQERMRVTHLQLVSKIASQVNAVQDLDQIFAQVVALTQETFNFHPVTIFTREAETGRAIIQACSLAGLRHHSQPLAVGEGIVGTAIVTQKTVIVNDTTADERFIAHLNPAQPDLATRAEISIPLIVNGSVLGVLDVQSPQVGAFGQTEKMVLEALAAEVASAIYKTHQLVRQQEQAWVTTAQLQVVKAINDRSSLEEIATAVTRLTTMLVGVDFCGILLWRPDRSHYDGAALYAPAPYCPTTTQIARFKQIRCPLGDWPALDAVHVGQEPRKTDQIPPWLNPYLPPHTTEIILNPIQNIADSVGVMFTSPLPSTSGITIGRYQFGRRREELLLNIVQQTAQAIESAQLRLAQQEEAWVTTVLLQVAEAVNRLGNLNDILDTIVRLTPMLVGVESVIILIWDEARQLFTAGPSQGVSTMGRGLIETLEVDPTELPGLGQLIRTDDQTTANTYSITPPSWLEAVLGTSRAHVLSLNARGRLVGAMLVGVDRTSDNYPLSSRRFNILSGIAHQAATAVVNNQLYRESAERDRLEQELNVAREIQASLIPDGRPDIPQCSVASYWEAARQVSGDFYDFIPLPDDKWGIVIADVADKGFPAALFMALSRTIIRTVATNRNRQDPGKVLMRVNEILDNDSQSDLFVTVFYAIWDVAKETLTYASGGHNPPLLHRCNGQTRLLKSKGIALGVLPEVHIDSKSIKLRPGDTLLFYTDGVTEAMNEDYDEFGLERLRLTLQNTADQGAAHILHAITASIREHAGETPQFDDITLIVMKHHR